MELVCKPSNFKSPIALVGAGTTSRDFYNSIKSTGAIVDLVVDSNPDLFGEYFYESNLQISELSSLTSFKGEIFILCAGNYQLIKDLNQLGISEVNYFYNYEVNKVFFNNWKTNLPWFPEILTTLKDDKSLQSLKAIVKAAELGSYLDAFSLTVPKPFFSSETLPITAGDVLLDLGSYRGSHLRALTLKDLKNLNKIICVEPNSGNNSYLVGLFDDDQRKMALWRLKLEIVNSAIKEVSGTGFNSNSSMANKVESKALKMATLKEGCEVSLLSLDSLIDLKPSIMTCDIEGDELNLLLGGQSFFEKLRPRVAISTYHHVSHLQSVYEYFNLLHPSSFQFRLHDYGFMDQVLYVHLH